MILRKILFWTHLVAGLIAGLSILIMCFTGTVLAFEKQIVSLAERDVSRVTSSPKAPRLSLRQLQRELHARYPEVRPTSVTLSSDPAAAVIFQLGRDQTLYANPYTGEITAPAATRTRDFMHLMEQWHRWLALGDDARAVGKAINGLCNLAFLLLAITGLYLWLPRTWSWRGIKPVAILNWRLAGKARDFNWHNSIGLWCAPVLVVLTLTALPISYRWAGSLIYTLAGETPPARPGPGGFATPDPTPLSASPGARPLGLDAQLPAVRQAYPQWEQITFQLADRRGRRSSQAGETGERNRPTGAPAPSLSAPNRSEQSAHASTAAGSLSVTVKIPGAWPRTASINLTLNPFTAEIIRSETFGELSPARRIRTWTRFLHTGEALGWWGQLLAGLACLGGCFLVYTGFALSWRRFFARHKSTGH